MVMSGYSCDRDQVLQSDGLVAVRTNPTGSDAVTELVAVVAPLQAEIALTAFAALIDNMVADRARRNKPWRSGRNNVPLRQTAWRQTSEHQRRRPNRVKDWPQTKQAAVSLR